MSEQPEKQCSHYHATNCDIAAPGQLAVAYDGGRMMCLDCGEMFVPPPIPKLYTAQQLEHAVAERDEIVNEVLGRVGKRWRSMTIDQAGNVEINGPTVAIVADVPGAALVVVRMALDQLCITQAEEAEKVRRECLEFLTAAVDQLGSNEAADLMVGWLQTQLGMTKPLAEVRKTLADAGDVRDNMSAVCFDCRRPYGDEHGFPDMVISDSAWRAISPSGNDGGLLCPSCICKRLHGAGITCKGAFMSGPIETVSPTHLKDELARERAAAWDAETGGHCDCLSRADGIGALHGHHDEQCPKYRAGAGGGE